MRNFRNLLGVLFYGLSIFLFWSMMAQIKLKQFFGTFTNDMFYGYVGLSIILLTILGLPLFVVNRVYIKKMMNNYRFNNRIEGFYSVELVGNSIKIKYRTIFNYLRIYILFSFIIYMVREYPNQAQLSNGSMLTAVSGMILFALLLLSLKSSVLVRTLKAVDNNSKIYKGSAWSFNNPLIIEIENVMKGKI